MSAWLMRSSDSRVLIHTRCQLEMINKEEEIQSQKPSDFDQNRGQHHRDQEELWDQEEQNLRRQRMNRQYGRQSQLEAEPSENEEPKKRSTRADAMTEAFRRRPQNPSEQPCSEKATATEKDERMRQQMIPEQ